MRVTFRDHQGKGAMVAAALVDAGHELVAQGGDVLVTDHDTDTALCDAHRSVVLYPHGGNPTVDWDGFLEPHPNVHTILCHGSGHAEVLAAYGHPARRVVVGWCYSEVAPPRPVVPPRRVLFAAPHRLGTGYMGPVLADAGIHALSALQDAGLDVHVRRMEDGRGLSHADIDAADLVVADWGTVAHLALARGVPVAMYGTRSGPPDIGHREPVHPAHWAEYRRACRYPVDMADGPLDVVLRRLERLSEPIADYRRRMVGWRLCRPALVEAVESAARVESRS